MLYDASLSTWDHHAHYILDGVYHGFRVIDPEASIPVYNVSNYKSCYSPTMYKKVSRTLNNELLTDKISLVGYVPNQIHVLSAIHKANGDVRIIKPCSKPNHILVNNLMKNVFSKFCYTKLDNVILQVNPNDFTATIDLQSAY